jgi:site-specific DNA recombinase
MKPVRCAIYTRKSSDEGLEQGFNSLDAQREACAAYILSQASEGWTQIAERYDDGGLSGGTLERPALQRLLADVAESKIDIIVVYKVDRLTRSLLDFAKLVEAFDNAGVSFVSITQSFNTTTSMGRLTLNMLLSFAQFEREVTAERIRDKIAASKAKGMWMGGTPPLGYEPDGRTLRIVEAHAALIRRIYDRYLELGNVPLLHAALQREQVRLPIRQRVRADGVIGGGFFSRGQLYAILTRRIYLGEITHKDQIFPGQHPAIIDRDIWERVQVSLAANAQGSRTRARAAQPSLLAGRIVDERGEPLIATHACKGKVRYRYYVSQGLQDGTSATGMRVPAREIENVVTERLVKLFDDSIELIATAWLQVPVDAYPLAAARAQEVAARLRQRDRALVGELVEQVRIERDRIEVSCTAVSVASVMGVETDPTAPVTIVLPSDVRLTRTGRAMRLIDTSGATTSGEPNAALIRLVAQAHRLWGMLRSERIDITRLAGREGMSAAYLTRVLRLAFLAPAVTEAILAGTQPAQLTVHRLTLGEAVPADWILQQACLVAG